MCVWLIIKGQEGGPRKMGLGERKVYNRDGENSDLPDLKKKKKLQLLLIPSWEKCSCLVIRANV